MKSKIISALFSLACVLLLSLNAPPNQQGPNGGAIKTAEGYFIELKNNPDTTFVTYLLDKKLKTISNKGISGEVKFFFPDSTALDVPLRPVSGNGFAARIAPGFHACKVIFHVLEKDISASFLKEEQIVQK